MTHDEMTKKGFDYLWAGCYRKDVGRHRHILVGSLGTPNEMVFLTHRRLPDPENSVCVHNWDYDGPLTEEKLNKIISIFQ
jgi:hypothetical protein